MAQSPKSAIERLIISEGKDVRPGAEFRLSVKPTNRSAATFVAVHQGAIHVERSVACLFKLPDDTPVIANWHGERRADAFSTTAGELKRLAAAWPGA